MKNVEQHIAEMSKKKRAILEELAANDNMTLLEYLTDLYKDVIPSSNTIIVISSNVEE